jgi:hypothetical protein
MNAISSGANRLLDSGNYRPVPGGERIALLRLTALSSGPAEGPNAVNLT